VAEADTGIKPLTHLELYGHKVFSKVLQFASNGSVPLGYPRNQLDITFYIFNSK
jgi:hypothetical protein